MRSVSVLINKGKQLVVEFVLNFMKYKAASVKTYYCSSATNKI